MTPEISIVIPTYNRCASLKRCLDSLLAQTGAPSFEVIVVDDGCSDGTRQMLEGYEATFPVRVLTTDRGGPGVARNRGAADAKGRLLLFLDDDTEADARCLAVHAETQRREPRTVVIGPMVRPGSGRRRSWVLWEQDELDKQYDAMRQGQYRPTPRQFFTANASMPIEEFRAAGGFDPRFKRAEDVELGYRLADAGVRFAFQTDAVVTHYAERTLAAWWRVPHQYGIYDVQMWRDKGRRGILDLIAHEFPERHPLVQLAVRLTAGGRRRARAAAGAALVVAACSGELGLFRLARPCYSLTFNLMYYQGVAEELGTTAIFRSIMRNSAADPSRR